MAGLKRPVSQAGPDVKKIVSRINRAVPAGREEVVRKAAAKAKDIHVAELRKATSTMRLRNVGKNGAKLGVRYTTRRVGYAMAEGEIFATGRAFPIIENKTVRHEIGSGRGHQSGSGFVLTVPGYKRGFFNTVQHPGTKGKKPWAKGYTRSKPHIRKIMRSEVFTIVKDNYKL